MPLPRSCLQCGVLSDSSYCPAHRAERKRIRNADRPIAKAVVAASPECARCGSIEDLTADHVLALANGGTNGAERQVLCRPCNSSKGARLVGTTSDRNDPRLTRGVDEAPVPMADTYLVLSDEERAQGFVRPLRLSYRHLTCGSVTTMGMAIAETYARQPAFYGATFCVRCSMHRPVGDAGEFAWIEADGSDGPKVGS